MEIDPQVWGILGAFVTGIGAILAAIIARKKTKEDLAAVSTGTLATLVKQVSELSSQLANERGERLEDTLRFERDVEELRVFYREQLRALQKEHKADINALQAEYERKLEESKVFYEQKIARMEQSYKDQIMALKARIRVLESGNGNGA